MDGIDDRFCDPNDDQDGVEDEFDDVFHFLKKQLFSILYKNTLISYRSSTAKSREVTQVFKILVKLLHLVKCHEKNQGILWTFLVVFA